jgi:hypothetical protein
MMNNNSLTKLYDHLEPHERLALIVAAAGRGDEADAQRLVRSSPGNLWKLPTYWGLAQGVIRLSSLYIMRQLDNAVRFWKVQGLLGSREAFSVGGGGWRGSREQCYRVLRLVAYELTVRADAFQRLMTELNTDAQALLDGLPGVDTVRQAEKVVRGLAFSEQEALEFLSERGDYNGRLLNVETLLNEMRAGLEESKKYWS